MSADTLRQAAALMRERANVVFSERWRLDPDEPQQWLSGALVIGESSEMDIAAHCASWHPAVALAVADWLDAQAALAEGMPGFDIEGMGDASGLAVAVVYLGGAA